MSCDLQVTSCDWCMQSFNFTSSSINFYQFRFSRYSGVINKGFDYSLKESYYFLLGRSDNITNLNMSFSKHTITPVVNKHECFAFTDKCITANTTNGTTKKVGLFERRMIRAHGTK